MMPTLRDSTMSHPGENSHQVRVKAYYKGTLGGSGAAMVLEERSGCSSVVARVVARSLHPPTPTPPPQAMINTSRMEEVE
ncbi:hypothetical protein PAMP_005116 [Pampus punctatissimus]